MTSPRPPAEAYEAFMVRCRFLPWAGELLDRVELFPKMRLLDCACGTGIVARVAASRLHGNGQFVGIDMNPSMIEIATRKAAEEDAVIEWRVGKAEALPFPDRSFDLVTVQQGLQFFPDKLAAMRECYRVLAPGGTLAIGIWSSLEKQGIQQDYAEAIERVSGSASMHASYGTVSEASLRDLLISAGFSDVSIEEVTIELSYDDRRSFVELMVEGTSIGVPTMHGRDDDERTRLTGEVESDMQKALARYSVGNSIVTPSTAFLALAHVTEDPKRF